jgi:hypothetical protein
MRTFPVQMFSGMRYWTVIGEDLLVMSVADAYLRYHGSGVMLPSRRQDLCGRGRTVSIVVRGDRARLAGRCLRIGSQQRPPSGEHNEAHRGLELWRFSRLDRRTNDILRSPDFGRTRSFRIGSFLDQPQSRPDHPCDFRYLPDQLRPAPGNMCGVPAIGPVCHLYEHFRNSGRKESAVGGVGQPQDSAELRKRGPLPEREDQLRAH